MLVGNAYAMMEQALNSSYAVFEGSDDVYTAAGPFLFPDYGLKVLFVDGWFVCRKPRCTQCHASLESVTLHFDCFRLFKQKCEADDSLGRLWAFAAWRLPWRWGPPVVLAETDFPQAFAVLAEKLDLNFLRELPTEIITLIWKRSATAMFWQMAFALQVAVDLRSAATKLHYLPFCNIGEWKRGEELRSSNDRAHYFRVTIDARGISLVERLEKKPRHSSKRSDHQVYIVQDAASFEAVRACCKVLVLDPTGRAKMLS